MGSRRVEMESKRYQNKQIRHLEAFILSKLRVLTLGMCYRCNGHSNISGQFCWNDENGMATEADGFEEGRMVIASVNCHKSFQVRINNYNLSLHTLGLC